ncbi:transcriptional repressor LexA [Lysobacter korlensis]|uniref:LexA repressor n=1 Tax=Lysobacter korlensis TaxID=553636 RepID=A0ABV6RPN8_9GAMM
MPLTPRQSEILAFLRRQIDEAGIAPSLQEIADAMGIALNAAAKHLKALEAAGVIERRPGQARGLRIVETMPRIRRRHLDTFELPILGRVAAGIPIGADARVQGFVPIDRALFTPVPDYLLRVHGDSMRDDGILDGDLVAVKRASEARHGQTVVARVDDEITIKRLDIRHDRIRLLPRNPEFAPIEIAPGTDFAIEGLYCGLVRRD